MNFEEIGLNTCKITKKYKDKKIKNKDINIYIADQEQLSKVNYLIPEIILDNDDEIMQHLP